MTDHCHLVELSDEKLLEQCSVKRTRGSGPGGQHRNKVETAIVITHLKTGVIGEASEKRSQDDNKVIAIKRLRQNLAILIRSKRTEQLGDVAQNRVQSKKISVNTNHDDFPILLAEALDRLHENEFDISRASEKLHCTNSQLMKFLKQLPAAFEYFNQQRQARDLPRLRH